jgi:hypothetical protein
LYESLYDIVKSEADELMREWRGRIPSSINLVCSNVNFVNYVISDDWVLTTRSQHSANSFKYHTSYLLPAYGFGPNLSVHTSARPIIRGQYGKVRM